MGLESSVAEISDLNALWPLGGDLRSAGDNHLRYIKVALKSLLTDIAQIGLHELSLTLTQASTEMTWTTSTPKAGDRLTLSLTQDGTGGRAITWNAIFQDTTTEIPTGAGDKVVFNFVGKSDGKWWMCSPPLWIEVD